VSVGLIEGPQVKQTDPWYFIPTFFKCPLLIDRERKNFWFIDLANWNLRQTAGGGPVVLRTLIAKANQSTEARAG